MNKLENEIKLMRSELDKFTNRWLYVMSKDNEAKDKEIAKLKLLVKEANARTEEKSKEYFILKKAYNQLLVQHSTVNIRA